MQQETDRTPGFLPVHVLSTLSGGMPERSTLVDHRHHPRAPYSLRRCFDVPTFATEGNLQ